MSTVDHVAAQSITGYYVRPVEEPNIAFKSPAYTNLSETLKGITGVAPILDQHFKNATRLSLQNTYYLSFGLPSISSSVKGKLEESGLFDVILELTDEILVGEEPIGSLEPMAVAVADPPECASPTETNDPEAFATDHFRNMQIPCAWSITQGSPEVTVAVVDFYFDVNNQEISSKMLNDPGVAPFVDGQGEYTSRLNATTPASIASAATLGRHGTAMLGAVAAEWGNGLCVAGTGGKTTLKAYSGIRNRPDGSRYFSILEAIQEACDEGNNVISLSAYSNFFSDPSPGARDLVRSLMSDVVDRGTTVLFAVRGATGRHMSDIPGVVLVGFGSKSGAYLEYDTANGDGEIEMIVPAVDAHRLSGPTNCRSGFGGSSLGTAFLAGIVGLMLDQNQCLTPIEVERILYETSNDIPNRQCCWPNRFEPGKGKVNAYRAVQMAGTDMTPPDLVISSGQTFTIENEHKVYNSIRVESGGILNVFNSQVYIEGNRFEQSRSGRIVVNRGAKLVARESVLSSSQNKGCRSDGWEGIHVHGNMDREQPNMFNSQGQLESNRPIAADDAGVVMLLDNTVIQNARNAVSTSVPGFPYPEQVDRWGGLVIAERATFRNNFRAAEFLRYPRRFSGHTFKNKSVFNSCLFITTDEQDDRSLGITAWDTDGVKVTRSTFLNLGRESIATIDGSFIIENGNTFINDRDDSKHRHIMSMATYPYQGEMVVGSEDESLIRNEFRSGNSVDIFITSLASAGTGGIKVLNNDFYGKTGGNQTYAVELEGPSTYLLRGNLIDASNPIRVTDTGVGLFSRGSRISCNLINNALFSMSFSGNNTGFKFLNNVFSGVGNRGTTISIRGEVDLNQGSSLNPANNKFETVPLTPNHVDIVVDASAPAFNYYYTDTSNPDDDFEPRGQSNYSKIATTLNEIPGCLSGLPPGKEIKEEDVLAAQNFYENIKNSSDPNSPDDAQQVENAKVNRNNLVNDFIDLAIKGQNLSKVNSLLSQIPGPEARIRHFGACVELGDFTGANSLLSVIDGLGSDYNDFVDVQGINLDRLQVAGQKYALNELDSITLDNIASSESSARGYARSILYLLKGKRYYDDYGEKKDSDLQNGGKTTTKAYPSSRIAVYPNPLNKGQFKISGKILQGSGMALLRRIDGSVISETKFYDTEEVTVDAPEIDGVYFIQVTKGDETATVKVIVKR